MLEPLLFAKSAGVSSIALLISVAFWAWLWGPIGLALAIPLTVWLVVFSHTVKGLEFIGILVDDEPGDPPVIFYQRILAGDDQEATELVRDAVKTGSELAVYDSILVPALARARRDHEMGQLPSAEYAHVIETTRAVLDRAITAEPAHAPDDAGGRGARPPVIAGCPVRTKPTASCSTVLSRLLEPDGYSMRIAPAGALVAETIATVVAINPAAIVVSSAGGQRAGAPSREAAALGLSGDPDRRRMLEPAGLGQAPHRPLRRRRRRRRRPPWARRGAICSASRRRRRGPPRTTASRFPRYAAASRLAASVRERFMTLSLGYKLSSEEQSPADLVRQAQMAEFYEQEILPKLKTLRPRRRARGRAGRPRRALNGAHGADPGDRQPHHANTSGGSSRRCSTGRW